MWNMSDRFVFMLTSNMLYSSWFSGFGFQMYAFMADKVSNSEVSVNTSNLCELKNSWLLFLLGYDILDDVPK